MSELYFEKSFDWVGSRFFFILSFSIFNFPFSISMEAALTMRLVEYWSNISRMSNSIGLVYMYGQIPLELSPETERQT